MSKATLERPKKSDTPRPKTPFGERREQPTSYPSRSCCQELVLDSEREEAERIIAEFRELEKVVELNDVGRFSAQIFKLENDRRGGSNHLEAERLRKARTIANHSLAEAAVEQMNEIHSVAKGIAVTILGRLAASFDAQLSEAAIDAEARLERLDIPISTGSDYALWRDAELQVLWSWRHVVQYQLKQLAWNGAGLPFLIWACTDEEGTAFYWG